jgi:hypothetical protein
VSVSATFGSPDPIPASTSIPMGIPAEIIAENAQDSIYEQSNNTTNYYYLSINYILQ